MAKIRNIRLPNDSTEYELEGSITDISDTTSTIDSIQTEYPDITASDKASTLFGKIKKFLADLKIKVNSLISDLANKQDASTAITTSNIGSQSVNYAAYAGNINAIDAYGRSFSAGLGYVRSMTDVNLSQFAMNNSISFANVENGYVNFYTNWNDTGNFPQVYGSGVCIPMLDNAYKMHIYGVSLTGRLYFGITYNHVWRSLRSVVTGNSNGYLDNWLTFSGANTRILGDSTGILYLAVSTTARVVNYNNNAFMPISASAFNVNSSRLVKENIVDMTEDEAKKILDLRVVDFDYINGKKDQCGLIAEEVKDIMPYCVTIPDNYSEENAKEQISNNEIPDVPSIDYSKLIAPIIRLVQIQQKEIDNLKQTINSLLQ